MIMVNLTYLLFCKRHFNLIRQWSISYLSELEEIATTNAYSEPCQTAKLECLTKKITDKSLDV